MEDRAVFQAEESFPVGEMGIVAIGQLISGTAKKGMKSIINGKQSEILKIESRNTLLESLTVGVPAGLLLSNIENSDITKGSTYNFQ